MPDALLTAAELAEIEARGAAATPGLWVVGGPWPSVTIYARRPERDEPEINVLGGDQVADLGRQSTRGEDGPDHQLDADADFIAHARADLPRAVGTIRVLAEAVLVFNAKYEAIEPAVADAFMFQETHGFPYSGENWAAELDAMVALAKRVMEGG